MKRQLSETSNSTMERLQYPYIAFDAQNVPFIEGTSMKVVELLEAREAFGWSAEELHFQFPHVSMPKIHAALMYYWDHRATIEQNLKERLLLATKLRNTHPISPLVERLKTEALT
jgi:uncharacterized protein (DUF433 family)